MIGQTVSHYKITEKLGEGGMGVVYKAEDTKLKRTVALKFLPLQSMAGEEEKARFEHEAQAAAALDHPNICTVYEINEADGQTFIAMAYVEGQSLQHLINSPLEGGAASAAGGVGRPLSFDDALNYATQTAEGLQAAHEKDIVHRDIKPANILITEKGQVRITDFGLAKLAGRTELTKEGTSMGTVAYMSPEQTQGANVDHRTDIWALGAVIYEMITGQQPFAGDYEQAVMYSIMNEDPEPPTALRTGVPLELERIVLKALAKEPGERYQNVQDVLVDLKRAKRRLKSEKTSVTKSAAKPQKGGNFWIYGGAVALVVLLVLAVFYLSPDRSQKIESIAVMPFVNASNDADAEYLSDGVTASLINRLAEFSNLKVMSRHSVARFKDDSGDPLAAGRLMAVKSVLAGQLDLRGEKLIVDVELLKVEDGQQLWGDRFDRDRKDILTIEHDIVKRISDKLKVKLAGNKQANQEHAVSLDPMAYDLYLRGRYIMHGTSDDGPARAQEYFRQAIEREPRLAIAHAGLGESYVRQAWLNSRDRDEIVPLAKAALKKAMDLDPGLCEAHVLAGDIALYFDWDWSAAEASYRSAMELNPGSDLAHREYANYLLLMDFPDKAIAEARLAQSLDPLSVYATHQLGWSLLATGRLSEAVIEFRKAIDLNPTWVWGNIKMGMAYALMGDQANATSAMLRADELLAGKLPSPLAQDWLAQIAYLCGDADRINETIARLRSQAELTYVDPFALADMFYRLGDFDKMFEYLEEGFEARSSLMPVMLLEGRFIWKKIKDDPRYLSLLKRMDFPNTKL